MHRCAALALTLVASLFVLAPPAAAKQFRLVAAGEGAPTVCEMSYGTSWRMFTRFVRARGTVDCSAAVRHNHQVNASGDLGNLCSGVMASCTSSVSTDSDSYSWSVQVIAPPGQGWVVGPHEGCSGIGTDNLRCTFRWEYSVVPSVV